MKTIVYVGLFLISGTLCAQVKSRDMSEETETKTVRIDDGRKVVEKKVKVTTKKENEIKLSEEDAGKVDQERIINDSDKMITQTIEIDNDMDPFYDSETKTVNYHQDGKIYKFLKNTNGFDILMANEETTFGSAIKSSNSNEYVIKTADFSGTGYFNSDGNFIIEYYDKELDQFVNKEFISPK
ncbi:hypothetical protein BZARG_158 [Bizionia argentinensis JUB59]|uniref:Uncharacterized protein n=1 Tax=Bizionia argentinensis JUB59 TaxID=1046627 RepID=G2E9E7_9FLAO|nr:hypothetical protein [Bizionia argentinensis]EGV44737.1 hypothetical protein BZARG_158 [Bizionia argentinensis JUB59]